jgi:putative sterol carrier protein
MTDPGFPVDVTISSDVASLYAVWLGRLPLTAALRSGRVQLEGATTVTRRLDEVLRLSPVAPFVAAMRATPA